MKTPKKKKNTGLGGKLERLRESDGLTRCVVFHMGFIDYILNIMNESYSFFEVHVVKFRCQSLSCVHCYHCSLKTWDTADR